MSQEQVFSVVWRECLVMHFIWTLRQWVQIMSFNEVTIFKKMLFQKYKIQVIVMKKVLAYWNKSCQGT